MMRRAEKRTEVTQGIIEELQLAFDPKRVNLQSHHLSHAAIILNLNLYFKEKIPRREIKAMLTLLDKLESKSKLQFNLEGETIKASIRSQLMNALTNYESLSIMQ
jgi:hypothetical protein